jgi:catalase-peroxidase
LAGTSNRDWWPDQLRLEILHQHSAKSDPMGEPRVAIRYT